MGYKVSLKMNPCIHIAIEQHNITKCHFLWFFYAKWPLER